MAAASAAGSAAPHAAGSETVHNAANTHMP